MNDSQKPRELTEDRKFEAFLSANRAPSTEPQKARVPKSPILRVARELSGKVGLTLTSTSNPEWDELVNLYGKSRDAFWLDDEGRKLSNENVAEFQQATALLVRHSLYIKGGEDKFNAVREEE